ncbi:MAG TPA: glycosyltransferase family 9 protein [Fimbriimonadaceae bacterium]|nr:glycosyltransferase family 9 protein [Fimbriimonadaceae bacterium]
MSGPRFLISRLSSLGDVVCSLPAAAALKKGFPDAHVTWVVHARFADVVRACSAVDEMLMEPPSSDEAYDAALDLQGLLKSGLVVARVKAKTKVGYHWQREGSWLFSQKVMPDPSSLHVVDQYVDVARAIGGEADRADFAFEPTAEAIAAMRPSVPQDFVVVNPGSAQAAKRWPVAHFAALIEEIPMKVVLVGASHETAGDEIMALCKKKPVNLTGHTTIAELIALIGMAKAHVGGDTGSTHIAAALGVPAIGLYSTTRPARSCPYGQIGRCHYDPKSLAWIQPADVFATLKEAIG